MLILGHWINKTYEGGIAAALLSKNRPAEGLDLVLCHKAQSKMQCLAHFSCPGEQQPLQW